MWRLLPLLCALAGTIFWGVEADFPVRGDWLALLLCFVFGLCGGGSLGISFSGLCEFGYSRSRASALQRVWLHDYDYGRDAAGADCSAGVRGLFLLAARDFGDGILRVLVF